MNTSLVITTINKPNKNIKIFNEKCKKNNWNFIVVGDVKTPKNFFISHGKYLNIQSQYKTNFKFAQSCPLNNYARKNIGYLEAIKDKADIIVETDDDNYPKNYFFDKKKIQYKVDEIRNKSWINIYDIFVKKKKFIWPRGLPLTEIFKNKIKIKKKINGEFYLQQGLSELNPDVDAIYRIVNEKINVKFKSDYKVSLGKSLSTFNSQNTIWFKKIFSLLYLPVTCSMRCTDIWRSLVVLRILKNDEKKILFFSTTMHQKRNNHDLINDFKEEIPMYLYNNKIYNILRKLILKKGEKNYINNLIKCYQALVDNNFLHKKEMKFLNHWIDDLNSLI